MQIFCLPFQFCRGEDGVTPGPNSKSSPSQMWGDNHSSSHWQHNSKVPVRTRPWTEEGGRTPEYLEGTRKEVGRTQTSSTESNPNHCLSKTSCQSLKEKTEKKRCLNYQWIFFFCMTDSSAKTLEAVLLSHCSLICNHSLPFWWGKGTKSRQESPGLHMSRLYNPTNERLQYHHFKLACFQSLSRSCRRSLEHWGSRNFHSSSSQ